MSSVCANENIGGATVAGILLALYTVGNCIGGFIFEPLHRFAGKLVVPIGLVFWILGTACFAFGHSVPSSSSRLLIRHRCADRLAGTVNT